MERFKKQLRRNKHNLKPEKQDEEDSQHIIWQGNSKESGEQGKFSTYESLYKKFGTKRGERDIYKLVQAR